MVTKAELDNLKKGWTLDSEWLKEHDDVWACKSAYQGIGDQSHHFYFLWIMEEDHWNVLNAVLSNFIMIFWSPS